MKQNLDRYEAYQVYLLKNGSYIMISDVDPITKLKNSDKDRYVDCKVGHKYTKNEALKNPSIVAIEDASNNIVIAIDVLSNIRCTITELRATEAIYLGKLTNDKQKDYSRILSSVL